MWSWHYGNWEDDESFEDYLQNVQGPRPWARGQEGKGLILPDGSIRVWATNTLGEPHHDDVGLPYAAKLDVFRSGATTVMSPDAENLFGIDRPTAEGIIERDGPEQNLFLLREFLSKRHTAGKLSGVEPETDPHAVWTEIGVTEVEPFGLERPSVTRLTAKRPQRSRVNQMPHSGRISHPMAAWEDLDGPLPEELPGYAPWIKGASGKGLISAGGDLLTWSVNEHGEPHHDVVSQDRSFHYVAKLFVRPSGRVFVPDPEALHLFGISREEAHRVLRREAANHGLRFAEARLCPTCGDPLGGEFDTFCPRCEWSEMDANLDSDPLSNPPDPTVDLHRGIQSAVKTSDKLHDFLMNPQHRPDLQTPEGQRWLTMLERLHALVGPKFDPLTPWMTREWKKGRIQHSEDGEIGHPYYRWVPPPDHPDGPFDPGVWQRQSLTHPVLGHWADFLQSNHPIRRQVGDIMRHHVQPFHDQVKAWDEAMTQAARDQALAGGKVVHTTPDQWTVRQLTTPEELRAEGDAMGHCVGGGSYGPSVESGQSLIYSLRDPQGRPHVTTEISPQRRHVDLPAYVNKYFDGDWDKASDYWGVPVDRMHELAAGAPLPPHGNNRREYEAPLMEGLQESSFAHPIPHGGEVVQIQGKGNREPIPEHQARMRSWFESFPEQDRPQHEDYDSLSEINDIEPHHLQDFDEYGLKAGHPSVNYPSMLNSMIEGRGGYRNPQYDSEHGERLYRLALKNGEIPELAQATEDFGQAQQENFDDWRNQNYHLIVPYPDDDDEWPQFDEDGDEISYDDAYKRYTDDEANWIEEHAGMQATQDMYSRLHPHFHVGGDPSGSVDARPEPGYYNEIYRKPSQPEIGQPQPGTFAATIPSHRWDKWLVAVEDAP